MKRILPYLVLLCFILINCKGFLPNPEILDNNQEDHTESPQISIYFNRNINGVQTQPSICINGTIIPLQIENSRKLMAQYGVAIYDNNIIIRGISTDDGIDRYTGCWVNNVWQDWTNNDIAIMEEQVSSITADNGNIYMNGNCRNALTDKYQPGYWQNKEWHPLPVINDNIDNMTFGITLSADGIIVVGIQQSYVGDKPEKPLESPDYVNTPGYWLNNKWQPLSVNYIFGGATAYNAVVGQGILYITGVQYEENNCRVGYWNNGVWYSLPVPETMIFNNFTKCFFYNDNLYIIGSMQNIDNGGYIPGYWENNNWISLPYSGNMAKVNYLYYHNGAIFAVGFNGEENGYWENGVWKTYDEIRDEELSIKAIIVRLLEINS